jgi:pimeloyl-ACP methyl ester carboxylesterase
MPSPVRLFLPGWGAPARAYAPGLPAGWSALRPPTFRQSRGSLEAYSVWLMAALEEAGEPVVLAGHSMGGALAVLAAAERPELVEHLILISPAGVPLTKPMRRSAAQFVARTAGRRFSTRLTAQAVAGVASAPSSALAVARAVRRLDLGAELARVRAAGVPATVVGCTSDTLVTTTHCRQIAAQLDATYREHVADGGHMWMFGRWSAFAAELDGGAARTPTGDATPLPRPH